MLQASCAKVSITAFEKGGDLMGWGLHDCRVEGVASELFARAFAFRDKQKTHVIVSCDLWAITQSLTDAVGKNLQASEFALSEHDFVICATHTHSGPGGYAHDLLYTLNGHGVSSHVFDTIVSGITTAALEACRSLKPARVFIHDADFSADDQVAFNRSLDAYNRNPDVDDIPDHLSHLALSPTMTLLHLQNEDESPLGLIAWFASHATSIHNDIKLLHGDHKGEASLLVERALAHKNPNFVAAFPQGAAGDVTPNFRHHKKRAMNLGVSDDDFESCTHVAEKQKQLALRVFDEAPRLGRALENEIDGATLYTDFSELEIAPEFTDGKTRFTGPSRYGLGLVAGTREGPGPLQKNRFLLEAATWLQDRFKKAFGKSNDIYGPMVPFLETGLGTSGKAFGFLPIKRIPVIDPTFIDVVRLRKAGHLEGVPWVQNCVPIHIFRIGDFALCTTPNEPTTVAAKRIVKRVLTSFEGKIKTALVAGYAQSYSGYLTTREEYQVQAYEGSTTVYGQWTLNAFEMRFEELVSQLKKPKSKRVFSNAQPYRLSEEEIEARAFRIVKHKDVQAAIAAFESKALNA